MIKLIVSDLDGTLLPTHKTLSPKTIETIKKIQAMGIKFALASGRAEPLMKPYARLLDVNEYAIINNGTLIKNLMTDEVLVRHKLAKEAQAIVMQEAFNKSIEFTLNANGIFYTNSQTRKFFYDKWNKAHKDALIHYEMVHRYDDILDLQADKILLIIDDENLINHYLEVFSKRDDCHVTKSQDNFLDIMPKGINKGQALAHLARVYKLNPEEIITFGDHDNDFEMITYATVSVAMPNGSEKAKKASSFIALDTSDHDGVSQTLEQFIHDGIIKPITK
jgi:Cof subfamily protein (haloacid dehalogenase superfamily)